MKIVIEKKGDNLKLQLLENDRSKPVTLELTPPLLDALLSLLQSARKADRFAMSYEVT